MKGSPLVALSVVPDSKDPDNSFAVVFSVSHMIADGFTYYQLLSFLSQDVQVAALSPERKDKFAVDQKAVMGKAESTWAYSGATLCNIVGSMLCGKKGEIVCFQVDESKVGREKENARAGSRKGFVSTNDIFCSTFANATSARVLMMPINLREKLADYTASDAGNYEGALVFGPGDYDHPSMIRNTLDKSGDQYMRATSRVLPKSCEGMRCQISMVSENEGSGWERFQNIPILILIPNLIL